MEKYKLYLTDENNTTIPFGIVNSPRIPLLGEKIPMNLFNKEQFERILLEGNYKDKKVVEHYEENFNKGYYFVENVEHVLHTSDKSSKELEAKIEVYARRK